MRHLQLVANTAQVQASDLMATRFSEPVSGKTGVVEALQLGARVADKNTASAKSFSVVTWGLVAVAHGLMIAAILLFQPQEIEKKEEPKPMLVSLVANPAPEPELVPVVPPPPPPAIKQKKPVEKVVKKIEKPVEQPLPQPEQVVSQPVTNPLPQEVVQETKASEVVEAPKAPVKEEVKAPAPEPVVEPPRFGVAYLNNPAPNYPSLSRRLGEEGRVLLRVLVSADGKAESVALEKSSGYERLDQAAIDVVSKWSFIPAKKGKDVLSAYVLVPVKFTLNQ